MQVLQADIRIPAANAFRAVCGCGSQVPGSLLGIARALILAGMSILLLISWGRQARSGELLAMELASEGQPPPQWPGGPSPSAQLDALLDDQGAAGSPTRADKVGDVPVLSTEAADADMRPRLNAYWDYGVVLESSDKLFRFHFGGRLDFDNTWYHQSQGLPFLLQDGADMRRARLRPDGSIGANVDFVTEVNFANIQDVTNEDSTAPIGSVGLTDFYVDFKQVPLVHNLRIGHFHEPMGLENLTSSNCWYYMERSPGHDAFLQPFNYVTGIETFDAWCDDRVTGTVAFQRVGKQDISPFAFGSGPGKYAVTGRVTCLPFYADDGRQLLHLGIGYTYGGTENNFYAANRPLVRARTGPQDVPNVIFTGTFFTPDAVQIADAEIAAVLGRFSLSAEYQRAMGTNIFGQLNDGVYSDPRGNVAYQGFYTEAGFFLNADDYRRYNKKNATWGRQLAQGESSAAQTDSPWLFAGHSPIQLLCRYSYLDLASGNPVLTPSSGAQAGWEHDITAGLDWYINPEVHFIVNYIYTRLDYVNGTGGNFNGLGCRMHLDF